MTRTCEFCGEPFEARSFRARFCSQQHQKRAYRGEKSPQPMPAEAALGAIAVSVRARLQSAGVWETVSGQTAFKLAMARAIGGGEIPSSTPLDELRSRRAARRQAR